MFINDSVSYDTVTGRKISDFERVRRVIRQYDYMLHTLNYNALNHAWNHLRKCFTESLNALCDSYDLCKAMLHTLNYNALTHA